MMNEGGIKMKKLISFIFFFAILLPISACDFKSSANSTSSNESGSDDNSSNDNSIPTIKIDWLTTCYDYSKYFDTESLNKIGFGNVVSAERIVVSTKYNGYTYSYTNANNDKIRVVYSIDNPLKLDDAYVYVEDKYISSTPLLQDGIFYMTINYWKNQHSLLYSNVSTDHAILYKRIRDFLPVEKEDIISWGLSEEKMNLLLQYSEYIPFRDISGISKVTPNPYTYDEYRCTLEPATNNVRIFNQIDYRYYYFRFYEDGTFSFLDKHGKYIVNKNVINEEYYYIEQVEFWYVKKFVEEQVSHYLGRDYTIYNSSQFEAYNSNHNKFKITYDNNSFVYAIITMDRSNDVMTINKVVYGENILYDIES